jgi:hypothetical protein
MERSIIMGAGAVLFLLLWAPGCNSDNTTTGPGGTPLTPVTSLFAYSSDSASVGLAWTASTNENLSDFNNYGITVKAPSGATVKTDSATKGSNGKLVSGLQAGVIYSFEVVAMPTSGSQSYSKSVAVAVSWSPAFRLTNEGTFPIQVYETSSSASFASGLVLFSPASRGPKTVSLANPGSDALLIDLYVRSEAGNAVSLRSAHLYNAGWRLTRFSDTTRAVNSLNDPRATPPDTITYAFTNTSESIDSVAVTTSRIYYFKGDNGNYGRILVKRNPGNGTLLWGSSPEQYLNLEISYQTQPYNPFSKKR